jgi:hypothetical protein
LTPFKIKTKEVNFIMNDNYGQERSAQAKADAEARKAAKEAEKANRPVDEEVEEETPVVEPTPVEPTPEG